MPEFGGSYNSIRIISEASAVVPVHVDIGLWLQCICFKRIVNTSLALGWKETLASIRCGRKQPGRFCHSSAVCLMTVDVTLALRPRITQTKQNKKQKSKLWLSAEVTSFLCISSQGMFQKTFSQSHCPVFWTKGERTQTKMQVAAADVYVLAFHCHCHKYLQTQKLTTTPILSLSGVQLDWTDHFA
jgi:hypothetical protein